MKRIIIALLLIQGLSLPTRCAESLSTDTNFSTNGAVDKGILKNTKSEGIYFELPKKAGDVLVYKITPTAGESANKPFYIAFQNKHLFVDSKTAAKTSMIGMYRQLPNSSTWDQVASLVVQSSAQKASEVRLLLNKSGELALLSKDASQVIKLGAKNMFAQESKNKK